MLEYFDDGVSGTGFEERTEFEKMLADAQSGKFKCLFVKDCSQFGRDLSRLNPDVFGKSKLQNIL